MSVWYNAVLLLVLAVCTFTDVRERKIYNQVLLPGLIVTLGLHLYAGWASLGESLLGFATGFAILLIPYLTGGMGAGDVKLLAVIGALKGVHFVLIAAVYMALLGCLFALLVLLFRKGALGRMRGIAFFLYARRYGVKLPLWIDRQSLSAAYPYGVAIAGGCIVTFFAEGWLM